MTLPQPLQNAVDRLSIADVVVKSISTMLASNVVPGINLFADDESSFQLMAPTCQRFAIFDSADDEDQRLVMFEVKAGVRLFRGQARELSEQELDDAILATIEASFLVSYTEMRKDGAFVDEDCLNRFGIANVPHNVWPYWRELVQSACSRMSLPRVVLPVHRLKKRDLQTPAPPIEKKSGKRSALA
jgi:hypothetical protein